MSQFPAPTADDIQRVVDLVVQTVSPLRIVLFGSAARGELRPGSDLDIMVVVPDGSDVRHCERGLHGMQRPGVGVPVDFIVVTPAEFERHRQSMGMVYGEVARDGRELYVT